MAHCLRLLPYEVLVIIQIYIAVRRHYHVMSLRRGLDSSRGASPGHHHSLLRQSGLDDFIPSYYGLSPLAEELLDMAHQVALKLILMLHSLLLHPLLTVDADFPVLLHRLVASDVDIFVWEKFYDLLQNGLEELESAVVTHAEVP